MTPQLIYERSLFFVPLSKQDARVLSSDSEYSYLYAVHTGKRFILGEQSIRTNIDLLNKYNKRFNTSLAPLPLFDAIDSLIPGVVTESATKQLPGKESAANQVSIDWKIDKLPESPDGIFGLLHNVEDVFASAKAGVRKSTSSGPDKAGIIAYIEKLGGNNPGPKELIKLLLYLAV